MKKTDIAMIILIASIGIVVAYFVASALPFLKLPEDGVKVQTIKPISSTLDAPSDKVFYNGAINPTVEVVVGGGATQ